MAEEETGFTFVDRRRLAPEMPAENLDSAESSEPESSEPESSEPESSEPESSEPESSEPVQPVQTQSSVPSDGEETGREPAPTTYDLIGYCINLLASQAWQKLGLLADPQTGEAQPDLADAKVAIDTLGDLTARMESAPVGVLPADLRRDLRVLLNDLRLNYVSQRGSTE